MKKTDLVLLACPRCGTIPRLEYSSRLELWWQYGKNGCHFCETFTAALDDLDESIIDWNTRVQNDFVV